MLTFSFSKHFVCTSFFSSYGYLKIHPQKSVIKIHSVQFLFKVTFKVLILHVHIFLTSLVTLGQKWDYFLEEKWKKNISMFGCATYISASALLCI